MEARRLAVKCESCGRFSIDEDLKEDLPSKKHLDRVRLSWIIRDANYSGASPILLTEDSLPSVLQRLPTRITVLDKLDRATQIIAGSQASAYEFVNVDIERDKFLYFSCDRQELDHIFRVLRYELKYIDAPDDGQLNQKVRLTARGWERAEELRAVGHKSDQAFVAMWFDTSTDLVFEQGIKPALKEVGFDDFRVDKRHFDGKIDDQIIAEIRRSALLVAEYTGSRAGVYFEDGFATGLGVPVVRACREDQVKEVHFDVNHYPILGWRDEAHLKELLVNRIRALGWARKNE
jgi:hypothetical protein